MEKRICATPDKLLKHELGRNDHLTFYYDTR